MIVDVPPGPGRPQKPDEHQAIEKPGQAPGPAPPLMIFFQPVGTGFLEKLHDCLADLPVALGQLPVLSIIFAGVDRRARRHPEVMGRTAHPRPKLFIWFAKNFFLIIPSPPAGGEGWVEGDKKKLLSLLQM